MHAPAATTVYFDGSCPLCRREIAVYRRAIPSTPVDWIDVSAGNTCGIDGRSCGDLMARFHVRTAEGQLLSGAAAFVALWLLFPGWRWLGRLRFAAGDAGRAGRVVPGIFAGAAVGPAARQAH